MNKLLNNKYLIINTISSGEFGTVYKCKNQDKLVAIKKDSNKILNYEFNIYLLLKDINFIPLIFDYFIIDNTSYLVLELMKFNLIEFKNNNNNNNIDKIKHLISKLIKGLEEIHELGIVHRDIKPSNICFDFNNNIKIIDFGLSKKIIEKKVHIDERRINGIIGSVNYSSINVINLLEPSRRDDIESVMYIYIFLLLTKDEYYKYNDLDTNKKKDVEIIEKLLVYFKKDTNISNIICKLLKYIRKLRFVQKPNYDYINKLILEE